MKLSRVALVVATGALAPALLLSTPALAATGTSSSSGTAVVATTDAESPYDTMSEDDLRIAILRIIADPATGRGVNREAQKALDGTVDDLRYFLKTGRWIAQDEDDRVAIMRIVADPASGDALRAAALKAFEGTPEEMRYFLEVGRYNV